MTEFKEGDLVRVPTYRRHGLDALRVGLIVELKEEGFVGDGPLVGVVWPHVATTRWYWTTDLVKVTG